ncbi:hypothetical protein A5699_28210 [Mycobacterium sp. E802]|uniref:hypothetical protein n=1 Tax=Mycobacterium sp. E802 TaxID=1834152 RepID=UPI000800CAF1|nr:hypothetical protein [Mycobacterium sp. E802]OBG84167.1 hypothetical protein A5699_28210 [Mycobacterium sp. E802]
MAVRPLVTTGAALLSAGALVAATPALFVPRDEVTIAAPTVTTTKLTQEQINLLALSLQGAWQSFTQGYGGIWFPGTNEDGDPVQGDCTLEGAVCQKGFTGLAYYLSDNILPLGNLDNIFFEGGFTELAHQAVRTIAVAIDAVDPTGRLDLTRRVDDFFSGGATKLVGNLLLDNLPQDGYAYGLTNSFFFGYGDNTGVYAAFTYVVDAIAQGDPTPTPNLINPFTSEVQIQESEESDVDTTLLAKKESGITSTSLPGPGSLLSLTTPKIASPLQGLKLSFKTPAVDESKPVNDLDVTKQDVDKGVVDGTVEGGTGTENPVEGGSGANPAGVEIKTPEPPKFLTPKAPEFKAPEFKLDLKPKAHITAKQTADEDASGTGSGGSKVGVDTTGGNKVTPPVLFGDGRPKGETNGSRFLKNLEKAVKGATGAGKDTGADGGKADGGEK